MERLSAWFERLLFPLEGNPLPRAALTLIGSGGKTSLLWLLARKLSRPGRRVLAAPSAKMYPPEETIPGVETAGILNRATGKLESLPPEELERTALSYDLALIEGDGSRGLPLKAWAPGEPVVPAFTAFTAGLIPLWPLGEKVSSRIIHRLPLFCRLSGAREGETLKSGHLVRVISGSKDAPGLFAAAKGKKILIFTQIEDDAALDKAGEIKALLPGTFHSSLFAVLGGSAKLDQVKVL
jgi:probable selenium-dependent hydroxylase accessory protein YqeC